MPDGRALGMLAIGLVISGLLWYQTSAPSRRTPIAARLMDHREAAAAATLQAALTAVANASLSTNGRADGGEADAFRSAVLALQRERQRRLRQACERGVSSARRPPRRPGVGGDVSAIVTPTRAKYYFSAPTLGVTYCAIPKCATTTLKGFFERVSGVQCAGGQLEHECADAYLSADGVPGREGQREAGKRRPRGRTNGTQPYLLLVVRNPWVRLVSSYVDKYVTERHKLTQSCYDRHGANRFGAPLNFSQFAQCVIGDYESGTPLDQHIAPMHWMCDPCTVHYAYIATVETLGDDFLYLSRHVFPQSTNHSAYDRAFAAGYRRPTEKSNKTAATYKLAYASLSDRELDAIVRLYRPDTLHYGYPERPV